MNARIKASAIATNKQKQMARELVAEEWERQSRDNMRRIFKLFCLSLNDEFGHGKSRLARLILTVTERAAEHKHDEVFWKHVDDRMEQIGMEFPKEDYNEMERDRKR